MLNTNTIYYNIIKLQIWLLTPQQTIMFVQHKSQSHNLKLSTRWLTCMLIDQHLLVNIKLPRVYYIIMTRNIGTYLPLG